MKNLNYTLLFALAGCMDSTLHKIKDNSGDDSSIDSQIDSSSDSTDSTDSDTSPPLSAPVAVCSVSPSEIEAIHASAEWIGNTSYDTDGGTIVSYDWTLISSPSGATATMPSGSGPNRRNFTPDVAGEYVGQLTVTDNDGLVSDSCTATLNATAGNGLWVEMFWTHSGDDMDLHMLKPGGTQETNGDCYYANCTSGLEWGAAGTADNPILDLDDIPGVGPENENIDSPANGTYTIGVRDYPGSVYNGNNDVTINIYIGGTLRWTDVRNVNREGSYEWFAEVSWPSGTITSL
jgi:hypothetical protein